MDEEEIRRSAALEQRHWWYAGRRALVRRLMADVPVGRGLDVGAGSGGNASVLHRAGWEMTALERSPTAAELVAARGLPVVRGDARQLPFADDSFDLVMSTDMWEHITDDLAVARESFRVCRPGGRLLVAVPVGMDLWSGHDVALGHVRRYERRELLDLIEGVGFRVHDTISWNVLLRPVARVRRRSNTSHSEMVPINPVLNAALRGVVAAEARLPLKSRRGMSLVVRAVKP